VAVQIRVPELGESVTEVEIAEWLKREGEWVSADENLAVLESEKVTVELPAPAAGRLVRVLKDKGERAAVGEAIAEIDENAEPAKASAPKAEAPEPEGEEAAAEGSRERPKPPPRPEPLRATPGAARAERAEEIVPMSAIRRRIAERLVSAQRTAALLTTFNEIDMGAVAELRRRYQEEFQRRFQVKLGIMPFFVKAAIEALKRTPQLNAEVRGTSIVYHRYYDIGIAVGSGRGLVVPVLRDADRMGFAEIERAIADFARRAQENRLLLEELEGGTFTISNGGVYGSLLSTPIVNPPQSGILGMHAIQERPVVRDGQIVVRPMMYVALTYDHRIVDGREAVTFLRHIKETIEDPARLLLEV
jgi:2-oxoglutarate dehydrogenase E2 component (dihydrolipoamide succinyltransferase)